MYGSQDLRRWLRSTLQAQAYRRYIDARQEWVRTLRNRRVCIPKHIPTAENAAGMLTKILPWKIVLTLRNMVLFPYKQPGI